MKFDRAFAAQVDDAFRQRYGSAAAASPAPAHSPSYGGAGDADIAARVRDPRSMKFNRAFAAETDRLYQQRHGGRK